MRITLIRHAQAVTNTRPELIGWYQPEVPLTEIGIRQATILEHRFRTEKYIESVDWIIVTSPAIRARSTAIIVLWIINPNQDSRLRELWQWDWENKSRDDIYTPELRQILADSLGAYRPPNWESQIDVADRMECWMHSLPSDSHSLAFSHGMAINCLVQRLIWLPQWTAHHHELSNTWITELRKNRFWWSLFRHNDHSHITGL